MAEEETAARTAAAGPFALLAKKLGPLPVGVYVAAGIALWWYLNRRKAGSASTTAAGANQQTDPAGNVGSINPASGYVYGTPEDSAAMAANNAGGGASSSGSSSASTIAGVYSDNNAWAEAAINYLVGIGVDPTAANSAIGQFLASQPLTTSQQGDVNLAIQRIGAPPQPPQPGTSPSPIVSPPSAGTVYATNPPTGLVTTSTSPTSIGLKWNAATNASGYTVSWGTSSAATDGSTTVTGTATSYTAGGLKPSTLYYFRVQATPAKDGSGFASTQKSTTATAGGTPPAGTGGAKPKPAQAYTTVTVTAWTPTPGKSGLAPWSSTLWGIAEHYGVRGGYQELARINGVADPSHITPGQKIKVPIG